MCVTGCERKSENLLLNKVTDVSVVQMVEGPGFDERAPALTADLCTSRIPVVRAAPVALLWVGVVV